MIDKEVEEIRSRRRKLLREKYNGNINILIDEAMNWQKENPDKIDSPKRNKKTKQAS